MNTNTKTLTITGPKKIEIIDAPIKSQLEPDELLVRIKYVALCGSDIKLFLGTYTAPHSYPIVIGHEWVGEIVKIGSDDNGTWSIGDTVTGDCSFYCNSCHYCSYNKNHCLTIQKKGITLDGACSQYVIVKKQHAYHCPKSSDPKLYALAEPMAVAVQAIVNHLPANDLKFVKRTLIIGTGGIGIMSMLCLLEHQVPHITIADINEEKLAVVRSLGFPNVTTLKTDLAADDSKYNEGFDLIIEAAGSPAGLSRALELANPCGKIVSIGHQKTVNLDFGLAMKKSLSIIASLGSTGGFEEAIQIIHKNQSVVSKLITRVVPLEKTPEFFQSDLACPQDIKVLIDLN
jgi:2-desacetyl-2-hydroxyethyl bacteriochlorophyllide A dehydrogenase